MLEIGSENVSKTLNEWLAERELQKEYPYFRDYLNKIYSFLFE